ncbi:hypothetical protein JCM11641_003609 [Rhodosporidiobolus odoratus]
MDTWDTLNPQASQDYLASLTHFLNGTGSAPSPFDPDSFDVTAYTTHLTGTNSKTPFSSSAFPSYDPNLFGSSASDLQVNPSLLGAYPPLGGANRAARGLNANANEPSSPELTSASSSGDSPASSAAVEMQQHSPVEPNGAGSGSASRARSTPRKVSGASGGGGGGTALVNANGNGHEKRKNPAQGNGAVKDRKSSEGHHSHATGVDGELERSESPEAPGKGGKGKTTERRKAQNRQAQRNFRERKEKHLKDLEIRVLELESASETQATENSALKALLEQLRSENARLKVFESAFTFTPPMSGGKQQQQGMPQNPAFVGLPSLPSVPGSAPQGEMARVGGNGGKVFEAEKPPTPPTAQDELDDIQGASGDGFKFDTSGLTFGLSPLPSQQQQQQQQQQPDDLFASFTLPSPPSTTTSSAAMSPASIAGVNQFTAYRDPLAALSSVANPGISTFADLDALFGVEVTPSPAVSASSAGAVSLDDQLAAFLAPSPPALQGSMSSGPSPAISSPPSHLPLGASPSMFSSPLPAGSPSLQPQTNAFSPSSSSSSSNPAATAAEPSPPLSSTSSLSAAQAMAGSGEGHVCALIKGLAERKNQVKAVGMGRDTALGAGSGTGAGLGAEKYEFDLDGLCSEMKAKATCQEAARQALKSAMAEDAAASGASYPRPL